MKKILIVVDMQNDFIDGALGTPEAVAIVPRVVEKIRQFDGTVWMTRDSHGSDYMETQEGRNLPVMHCIVGSDGWKIRPEIAACGADNIFNKPTFGSVAMVNHLVALNASEGVESVELIGLCTDICVISNAMLIKANLPEVPVIVDAACCAGVTPQSHANALAAMRMCQIRVDNG